MIKYMKRFYLESDTRFDPDIVEYNKYSGWVRKKQKKKWLWLTTITMNKEGKPTYINRLQLVKIKDGKVIK